MRLCPGEMFESHTSGECRCPHPRPGARGGGWHQGSVFLSGTLVNSRSLHICVLFQWLLFPWSLKWTSSDHSWGASQTVGEMASCPGGLFCMLPSGPS